MATQPGDKLIGKTTEVSCKSIRMMSGEVDAEYLTGTNADTISFDCWVLRKEKYLTLSPRLLQKSAASRS